MKHTYSKILIRFGELVLKKKNRHMFVNVLANNILHIVGTKPEVAFDRMYLPYTEENMHKLQYVFGIDSYSPVVVVENSMVAFEKAVLDLVNTNSHTFKIEAHRNSKKFEFNSNQINNHLGAYVLQHTNLKVNVHTPDQVFYVEVREKNSYIFTNFTKGLGGLPVGSSGKVLHMLSGGFDSPVAAFQMLKRGVKLDFLTFITPPLTDEKTNEKVLNLVKTLNRYQTTSMLYLANYSTLMSYIQMCDDESFRITLMRRSFYRIGQSLCEKYGYMAMSNGENLGQVASQTLESMHVIANGLNYQVLRPLLTYDKNEIINIARKIETHDISVIKANETCESFAPKKPVTKPTLNQVLELENSLDRLTQYETQLVENNIEVFKIKKEQTKW
ncbi:tRNA uracil 4-sulfurtransferase ThiI [Mycoplasma corogypsi]|uniref:tRNA uracil 4-sulfurtransferase ThiI n=1 Tax=Mycoplasma corogypsi TaxID=2106 RepID=UPI0038736F6A